MGQKASKRFDLNGSWALITGGAGLLGEEHAKALGEMGAQVVLTDIDEEKVAKKCAQLNEEMGKDFTHPVPMDVTSKESIQKALKICEEKYQAPTVLINNAAINPHVKKKSLSDSDFLETSRFELFPLESWNQQLSVGLTGAFLCSQVFGHKMKELGGGVILNISSDLSVIAPDQRLYRKDGLPEDKQPVKPVSYSVVKTALIGLTRYLATYWAKDNIRVNALSPGGVFHDHPEEFVEKLTDLIPMGRMAQKNEYSGTIQFLCSQASSYLTGQNIVMDGGRSIL